MDARQPHLTAEELTLPLTPLKVKLEDLNEDGKLYDEAETTRIIRFIQANPPADPGNYSRDNNKSHARAARYSAQSLQGKFGVIVFDHVYYAVYRGVKQDCHLGNGSCSYGKLAQNILTGEWAVLKISLPDFAQKEVNHEYRMLEVLGMSIGYLERVQGNDHSEFILRQRRGQQQWSDITIRNQYHLLMKLVPGMSLETLRTSNMPYDDSRLLEIIIQVLTKYVDIQSKHIIHGDLTLDHIFYDPHTNTAAMIGWGISKKKPLLGNPSGQLFYSRDYAAPEMQKYRRGKKTVYSVGTDVYALGTSIIKFLALDADDVSCKKLESVALRTAIHEYCLHQLHARKPKMRPSPEAALMFFKHLQEKYLNVMSAPLRKIGMLSLREYYECLEAVKMQLRVEIVDRVAPGSVRLSYANFLTKFMCKLAPGEAAELNMENFVYAMAALENFRATLKLFDELIIIDDTKRSPKEYIALRQDLELMGVCSSQRCFVAQGENFFRQTENVFSHLQSDSPPVRQYYYCVSTHAAQIAKEYSLGEKVCLIDAGLASRFTDEAEKIDAFALADVDAEFCSIRQSLESLAAQYAAVNLPGSLECVTAIKTVIDDFSSRYKERSLGYEHIIMSLDNLKQTLSQSEPPPPASQISLHHRAMFKATHLRKNCFATERIEVIKEQYKHFVTGRESLSGIRIK